MSTRLSQTLFWCLHLCLHVYTLLLHLTCYSVYTTLTKTVCFGVYTLCLHDYHKDSLLLVSTCLHLCLHYSHKDTVLVSTTYVYTTLAPSLLECLHLCAHRLGGRVGGGERRGQTSPYKTIFTAGQEQEAHSLRAVRQHGVGVGVGETHLKCRIAFLGRPPLPSRSSNQASSCSRSVGVRGGVG